MKIPGLHSTREFLRSYPDGEAAAQIVGLTGLDGNGIEGIELAAEKRLAGKPGSRRVMKDRLGRIVEDAWLKEPMNGENITLTIDSRLQNLAYEALGRQVENLKAKGGSIVIADPKTGDILALANYPSFDPNNRGKISRTGVRNRAIVDTYEPGSTMKPFSVAAGLEEKKVTPNTLFQIGRSMSFGRHSIGDSHYSKELTVSGIIQQSSNIGTSKVALLMTPQVMCLTTTSSVSATRRRSASRVRWPAVCVLQRTGVRSSRRLCPTVTASRFLCFSKSVPTRCLHVTGT